MSYMILGARGMLGHALRALLDQRGLRYVGLDLPEFDMTDRAQVEAAIPTGTAAVLNCAAYTDVDKAEQDEATATKLNGEIGRHAGARDGRARCTAGALQH